MGCFQHEYDIKLKENAIPIAYPPRRVPIGLKERLKEKLEQLVKDNVIERVNECAEWVNHLVTAEKKDKSLRLCIDPQKLNENIIDEHAYIPTFEDVASKLNGMKYFSVLDLKDGYWHVRLSKNSRKYCTFATPFGNFRFIRMPFGLKSAPSVFQRMNYENFGDIENVLSYFDDILIFSRTREEHDATLKKVLERARERGARFNANKVQIAVESVKYLGHIFSYNSIKPDPDRLVAIEQMTRPKNKKDLQTFLGVINFLSPFIPNMSELTAPLRTLLRKNVIYQWTVSHNKVFNDIKAIILKSNILVPFDITKEIFIQCDASSNGLGCGLIQDGKPISFASRSLSSAERNYAQIEKEMLSIIFACKKFHFYTYGRTVTVVNDHQPLLGIMKKEINKIASAKLQRMRLKLLNYDIRLQYAPGKTIVLADYLSRYMNELETGEDNTITESILTINATDEKKVEVQNETKKDEMLNEIMNYCKNGWPNDKTKCPMNLRYYYKLRNDIYLEDGVLFFNDRIIVPTTMRRKILEALHEPHFGITKTLKRAQGSVFWPNICNEIENMISHCHVCQVNQRKNQKEPLMNHEIPKKPFDTIACDILEHKSKDFLAIIDYYSNWIELIKLKSKKAAEINYQLLKVFSAYGYPRVIRADNMPFGSYECTEFAKKYDIKIVTSSPNYPQSNGMAERAVQICKNILKKSTTDEEIFRSLLAYRTTPTKNMSYSPAELLQNRNLRTNIPMHEKKFEPKLCIDATDQHKNKRIISKKYYDRNAKYRPDLQTKQTVLFQLNDKWKEGEIIKKHETPRSFVVRSEGRIYRRNTKHIRPFNKTNNAVESPSDLRSHQKTTRSGRTY